MKKLALGLILMVATATSFAKNDNTATPVGEKITIVNDMDDELRVHTGFGETTLSARGGKTTVTCSPGKKVKEKAMWCLK